MPAACLMLQGTSSNVGKSVLAAGLCRLLFRQGFNVAPFKSQNMALNSYVTKDGGEMGRAQAVQAEAAGIEPNVKMNPILLKPKEDMSAQVIVMGKPLSDMGAAEYRQRYVPLGLEVVKKALHALCLQYEAVIIEGAGSPAEVNLRDRDIANMEIALMADAPVILVADIDRGGVFASIIGTLELLAPREKELVAGFLINKFRGNINLLQDGVEFLEERTGLPVLGVIPHIRNLDIEEEDSVALLEREDKRRTGMQEEDKKLDVVVLRFPRISNYTDFSPLDAEQDVSLRYVERVEDIGEPHAVIFPGTKSTTADLEFLYSSGLAEQAMELFSKGTALVGICGGFQMMGEELHDPEKTEGANSNVQKGLGAFPMSTVFSSAKITRQVEAIVSSHSSWGDLAGIQLFGYEIRHGKSSIFKDMPSITLAGEQKKEIIGLATENMGAVGTYLHDLFYNDTFRRRWLDFLRSSNNLPPVESTGELINSRKRKEEAYDRLADVLKENIDLERIYRIMGLKGAGC